MDGEERRSGRILLVKRSSKGEIRLERVVLPYRLFLGNFGFVLRFKFVTYMQSYSL